MGNNGFSIDPDIDPRFAEGLDYLLHEASVRPEEIDGAGAQVSDGVLTGPEFLRFVYDNPRWRDYLPALDRAGLRHPLDPRGIPSAILQRTVDLRKKIEGELKVSPADESYCERVVPAFYAAGSRTFDEGGLGFSYPFGVFEGKNELTAGEAFAAVLNPDLPYGSCTEATYKILSAFQAAGIPCRVDAVLTQNHMFARSEGKVLDPSNIGTIGWERVLASDAEVAATYYVGSSLGHADPLLRQRFSEIASNLAPDLPGVMSERVHLLWTAGRHDDAWKEIDRMLAAHPDNSQIIHSLQGTFAMSAASWRESENPWLRIVQKYPDNVYALRALVDQCSVDRNFGRAAALLKVQQPGSGNAEILLALEALAAGRKAEAEALVGDSLSLRTDHPYALALHAQIASNASRIEEAEMALRRSMDAAPNLSGSHSLLSALHLVRGDPEAASREAKREGLSSAGNSGDFFALASAALAAGDFRSARDEALNAIRQYPSAPVGYSLLSNIAAQAGMVDLGIRLSERALELAVDPLSQGEIHAQLASLYLMKPDLREAMRQQRLCEELAPDSPSVFMSGILIAQEVHDDPRALELARRSVDRFPEVSWSHSALAGEYYRLGRINQAREAVGEALARNPRDLGALMIDLLIRYQDGDSAGFRARGEEIRSKFGTFPYSDSIDATISFLDGDDSALKKALSASFSFPADRNALLILGLASLQEGGFQGAERIAVRLDRLYDKDSSGPFLLAQIAFKRGFLQEAERQARRALERDPDGDSRIPVFSARALLEKIAERRAGPFLDTTPRNK